MEEEAREILKSALIAEAPHTMNLAQAIRRHIEPVGGVELRLRDREAIRRPPVLNR